MAVRRNDDGILKYVLRYIDQNALSNEHWNVIEPFLKRSAVHFGHTIDYVARILAWRHLTRDDLDIDGWRPIMETILDKHGRLGNDSEVCWTIYTHQLLQMEINRQNASGIVENCGALALVALLHCVNAGLVDRVIFSEALARIETETAVGRLWPVFLEWKTRRWPQHEQVNLANSTIQGLTASGAYIYDPTILLAVFQNVAEAEFAGVAFAIEPRLSIYDDEDEEDQEVDDHDIF